MGLAFFNVHQGYAVEWPKVTGRGNVPKAVGITWLVWIIFVPVVYILGVLIFAPKERKVEKEQIEEYVKRKSLLREEESREGASVPE
jgi:cytochrome c-type biogenesis protein CcmH/NrfF